MDAADPTAWTPLSVVESLDQLPDMVLSGFLFFYRDNPTNPLVARKWRQTLPYFLHAGIRNERASQIRRQLMYGSAGGSFHIRSSLLIFIVSFLL
jgi:hypothetical protein